MAFKKTLRSEADIIILGGNVKEKYPVNFEYYANEHVYKVVAKYFADNTEWRRLRLDDGTFEDVTTATIDADLETAAPYSKIGGKKGAVRAHNPAARAAILFDPSAEDETAESNPDEIKKVRQPKRTRKSKKKNNKKI